jgi:hypothetical protein
VLDNPSPHPLATAIPSICRDTTAIAIRCGVDESATSDDVAVTPLPQNLSRGPFVRMSARPADQLTSTLVGAEENKTMRPSIRVG